MPDERSSDLPSDEKISRMRLVLPCLVLASGVASCAPPPSSPPSGRMLGYGTPGVSAYVPADRAASLQALQADCAAAPAAAPSATTGLPAACAQLRDTLHNQPGNAVSGVPAAGGS